MNCLRTLARSDRVRVEREVRPHESHECDVAGLRRAFRNMNTTNHIASDHNDAFINEAKAMPEGVVGTD